MKKRKKEKEKKNMKPESALKIRDSPHKVGQIRIKMCNYGERSDVPYLNIKNNQQWALFTQNKNSIYYKEKKK